LKLKQKCNTPWNSAYTVWLRPLELITNWLIQCGDKYKYSRKLVSEDTMRYLLKWMFIEIICFFQIILKTENFIYRLFVFVQFPGSICMHACTLNDFLRFSPLLLHHLFLWSGTVCRDYNMPSLNTLILLPEFRLCPKNRVAISHDF
jgi:hypothetical protein